MSERPPVPARSIEGLLQLMRTLRDPQTGCAWDLEQSFDTIAPFTVEEAYEVADAVERGDLDDLCDELGDLLFQVVFHAQMAAEQGAFGFADVVSGVVEKMTRRHPHIFGDMTFATTAELKVHWEALKAIERQGKRADQASMTSGEADADADRSAGRRPSVEVAQLSALDGVALNLPALIRAEKIQKRAARTGFDWPEASLVFDKVLEELDEVREAAGEQDAAAVRDEIGDLLFAVVNLARHHQVDAETALREATRKFDSRFRDVEGLATERALALKDQDIETLEELWNEVKRRRAKPHSSHP